MNHVLNDMLRTNKNTRNNVTITDIFRFKKPAHISSATASILNHSYSTNQRKNIYSFININDWLIYVLSLTVNLYLRMLSVVHT